MTGIASIDRFHMVQMLTRSFNIFRVQIMKQFNKSSREYRLLKSPWILYLMKYDKLNRTTPYYDWHFKDYLTQEHIVLDGLDCDQTLENTYWVMQDFMVAIQNNDEKKVIHLLHSKQTVGKQMHQTLLTFKHNYSGVLNGISSTYSNGCLEGVNRKIKQRDAPGSAWEWGTSPTPAPNPQAASWPQERNAPCHRLQNTEISSKIPICH